MDKLKTLFVAFLCSFFLLAVTHKSHGAPQMALKSVSIATADPYYADGATDSARYLNLLLASRHHVALPCGTWLLKSGLLMPSHSSLAGSGACTIIKSDPAIAASAWWGEIPGGSVTARIVVSNASARGNSDISLENFELDVSSGFLSAGHAMAFFKTAGVTVRKIRFIGSSRNSTQDAVAFVNSTGYKIIDNYATGFENACYDNWNASSDAIITNNICDGNFLTSWGVLVNGLDGAPAAATTSDITVANNEIRNVSGVGIDVRGLCYKGTCGLVRDAVVSLNVVVNPGWHCIWIGDVARVRAVGNRLLDCQKVGLYIASQISGGASSDVTATENSIYNASSGETGKYSAITLGNSTDTIESPVLMFNDISGANHRYSIQVRAGVQRAQIFPGKMSAGKNGVISDGGKGTRVDDSGPERTIVGSDSMTEYDKDIIANCSSACTLTLLDPARFPDRVVRITNISATGAVSSGSSNIKTPGSRSMTSTILAAKQGSWTILKSGGVNAAYWVVETAN